MESRCLEGLRSLHACACACERASLLRVLTCYVFPGNVCGVRCEVSRFTQPVYWFDIDKWTVCIAKLFPVNFSKQRLTFPKLPLPIALRIWKLSKFTAKEKSRKSLLSTNRKFETEILRFSSSNYSKASSSKTSIHIHTNIQLNRINAGYQWHRKWITWDGWNTILPLGGQQGHFLFYSSPW